MWMQHIKVSDDPNDDPWENDSLGCRKEEGLQLTKLIENIEHPFVLSVSGPWGSGKTTFIEMWKQHLQNEGFHCLYFNAWRNDFVSDPLIALVGEMELDTKELNPALRKKLKGKIDSLKTVSKVIVRHGLPALFKKLSGDLIDAEAIADAFSESFETYEKEKESLKTFRENLQGYAGLVRDNSEHSLVFFVDELDRCRPTYAVEFLERIKHLFDVDNVIFILALASGQLEASIKALYGDDTDSARYLRRMIDLSYELRIPSAKAYMPVLLQAFEIHKLENWTDSSELRNAAKILGTVADAFRLSLREQQQAIAHLAIILRIAGTKLEYMELASLMFLGAVRQECC